MEFVVSACNLKKPKNQKSFPKKSSVNYVEIMFSTPFLLVFFEGWLPFATNSPIITPRTTTWLMKA